jgi:uncharacterized protein YggE
MLRTTCLLLLGLGALGCARPVVINTGSPESGAPPNGLMVTGEGEAKAPPDIARTNVGVEVRAETVEQASAEANQRMAALIAAIKQLGVADRDLRTHSFSISFEPAPTPPMPLQQSAPAVEAPRGKVAAGATAAPAPAAPQQPVLPRGFYRASNMLEVTIRNLENAGRVLQAATNAGANNVWGLSFEIEDPKVLAAKARVDAMANAKKNAAELAKLAGVELGAIVSISENEGSSAPGPMYQMKAAMADGGGDVPVEQGEVVITHQVVLVYALREH